ncbi:MAG: superinfection immunity protein [Oscillospiraceae bacterium]|nr:superinfection immunity protein [Oscillospiraceae bacterium]
MPYLVANKKGHPQETAIFILNLFAGWTIIAWIIALVWAFTQPKITNSQQALIGNADELLKYKQLLDNDVISQEEFDTKKKQILDM